MPLSNAMASGQCVPRMIFADVQWSGGRHLCTPLAVQDVKHGKMVYRPIQEMARARKKCWLNAPTTTRRASSLNLSLSIL